MTISSPASPRPPWDLDLVVIAPPGNHLFALTDPYVELCWAAHIGPSATLLARAFGRYLDRHSGGGTVDLREIATAIGIAGGVHHDHPTINARAARSLQRLTQFHLVSWDPASQQVTTTGRVAPVPVRLLDRTLPDTRRLHVELVHLALAAGGRGEPGVPGVPGRVLAPAASPSSSPGRGR